MAYQRRKRRFDRKKVVLVERTICILILLALLALAGRWIAGPLSKEDSQKKKPVSYTHLDVYKRQELFREFPFVLTQKSVPQIHFRFRMFTSIRSLLWRSMKNSRGFLF